MTDERDWWMKPRKVSVCVDTEGWFDSYAVELVKQISKNGDNAVFARQVSDVQAGGVAFYLSCTKLTPPEVLARNPHNIIIHASALPDGRGFSPVVWQVLKGKDRIPVVMIFAADEADAGDILIQDEIELEGTELNQEIRHRLGEKIQAMCVDYLSLPEPPVGYPQEGEGSWYRRRTPEDSRLDPELTIADQFNLLRVVDNERYPAFFDYRGKRYVVRIDTKKD